MSNMLKTFFSNTTDIVLLVFSISTVALTFMGVLDSQVFNMLATAVFGYYFGKSSPDDKPNSNLG